VTEHFRFRQLLIIIFTLMSACVPGLAAAVGLALE
jgi:hypothetical protein